MFVVVTVEDDKIKSVKTFDDLIDAKIAADEAGEEFDYDHGDIGVFDTTKIGVSKKVYSPELGEDDEEFDEDEEEADEDDEDEDD